MASPIFPTADGRGYRMYYAGERAKGIGFAEAAVADPLSWHEHPASPVLTPRADNWEGDMINQPRVVKVTHEHWRMYYTGWGFAGPGTPWALGLAESFDGGTHWQRYQEAPIFPRGAALAGWRRRLRAHGAPGGRPLADVVHRRASATQHGTRISPLSVRPPRRTAYTGEKYPAIRVLTDDFSDGAARSVTSRCYVRYDDGVFCLWYSFAKPDYRISYAESLDGVHWERSPIAPVLAVSPPLPGMIPGLEVFESPEVQRVDGKYRLWFCGNNFGSVGYAEGTPGHEHCDRLSWGNTPSPMPPGAPGPPSNEEPCCRRGSWQFRAGIQ